MAVVKNLMVRAGADFSGMRREMDKANKNFREFKSGMSSTLKGIGIALASLGIGSVIKDAVKSAMEVEGSMQQINRTMGTSAQAFIDWAGKGAMAYNLAKSDALKYGQVYSNLTSLFSKSTTQTMTLTQDLLKATGVIASSTGRNMTDVMERVRSGMLGNTEAIEDLGIYVNVAMIESTNAFKQFANGKHWDQLDFQTRQQIRYFAILEQSTRKFGTAVNDNTNTRMAQFIAQLKNIQLGLGQAFLPIWNAVLPALTQMAAALASIMSVVAQFTQALFGKADVQAQTQATTAQTGAVTDLGNAYKDAGKKAKGAVAGFDEVNTLADSSGSAGSGSSAAGPAVDTSGLGGIGQSTQKVSEKVREMANKVKAAFKEMSDFVKTHKDIIIAALGGLAAGFASFLLISNWSKIVAGLRTAFTTLAVAIGAVTWEIVLVAAAIAAVVAGFIYFYRTNESFRGVVDGILKAIGVMAKWLWNDVMIPFGSWLADVMPKAWDAVGQAAKSLWDSVLKPLGSWLADVLPKAWGAVTAAAEWLWKNVLVPFGNFMVWLWNNVLVPVGGVLTEVLGVAFQTVADIAKSFWENVLIPLGLALTEMFVPAVEAVASVVNLLWTNGLIPLGKFIDTVFKPIWKSLTDTFVYLWNNVLKPLAVYIGGAFYTVFDNVFNGIGTIIEGAKGIFIGFMNFITGVFTGNWKTAWEGIKTIFKGVFDSLWGIVKTPLNMIIDGINALISGLNSISFSTPDWFPGDLGGKSFGINIPSIPKLAKGGITNGPMVAMIGDNPGGQEVVSPLDDLQDIIASAVGNAVMGAMQVMGGSGQNQGGKDVVLQIDGRTFARLIKPWMDNEQGRIGSAIIRTT